MAMDTTRRIRNLSALLEISKALMAERDLDTLLALVMNRVTAVLEAERSSLFLVDHDTNELWSRIAQDAEINEIRFPVGKGIAGFVAASREVVNIPDAYADSRFNKEIDLKTGFKTRNILCAPMVGRDDRVIGVIQVLNKSLGAFTMEDEDLIIAFGAHAGMAVENADLYRERELTFRSFLKTLAHAIDARDPVTAGHSERVARYAMNVARALRYDDEHIRLIEYAAAVHDIGKIGVRDNILLKPGQLTPEEYGLIKKHAGYTKEILEQMYLARDLRMLPHIAASHHEKLDGTGYPDGLKGDAISEAARILAVADVYDALTAYDRPYKRAMTVEESLAILEKGKGTAFDPRIVDLFKNAKCYAIERRQYKRIDQNFAIEFSVMTRENAAARMGYASKTLNICGGGLLVKSEVNIALGTYLDMTLHLPDTVCNVVGSVVRCTKSGADSSACDVGVKFLNLAPMLQEKLAAYLTNIEGETAK
ncbi:MAG: GAF domain-containing protein [Planctomycetota bacterium]|nr:GAF domain-containing protein [Planctomycetota bacterium]